MTPTHNREEVETAVRRYISVRDDIDAGKVQFSPEMGMPPRHPNRDVTKPERVGR